MTDEVQTYAGEAPTAPPPDPNSSAALEQIKDQALESLSHEEDATAYIHERQDRESEARGEQPVTPVHERADRLREALRVAREEAGEALEGADGTQEPREGEIEGARNLAKYEMRVEQHLEKHPTYWEDMRSTFSAIPPADHIAGFLVESNVGPEIVSRMCQHPEAIEELNALHPQHAARVLAQLEGVIMAERRTLPQAPARQHTKAPPPLRAPRGGAAPPKNAHALASKSEDVSDYVKFRDQQERARASR